MSAFDDREKDYLHFAISAFLENHKISELIEMVNYCIIDKENE